MVAPRNLVFVDLETTGANAQVDRVTEIGIVEVSDAGVEEWSTLVNPGTPIPPFITRLTGIDDRMVADAPHFAEMADAVLARLDGRLFVAHNARFDYNFLRAEFRRVGIDFRAEVLCTVKFSRKLFPQHPNHNLDALVERHGLPVDTRHRALADARAIHAFWNRIHADMPGEVVQAILADLLQTPALPPGLDPGVLDNLPENCGVYTLCRDDGQALFIARANNLRRAAQAHFMPGSKAGRKGAFLADVRRIEWVETAGELGAALTEARLVETRHPLHPRSGTRETAPCAWRLERAPNGAMTVCLADAEEPGFALTDDFFGPFPNHRKAHETLRKLAQVHRLCLHQLALERPHKRGGPCSAVERQECKGLCVGRESTGQHDLRLMTALSRLRLERWPFPGPIGIREAAVSWGGTPQLHIVDRWRYLGSVTSEPEAFARLDTPVRFDTAIYHLLVRALSQGRADIVPLGPPPPE